ncbi:hypothetical protein ACFE04_006362 [Oxalis oulophora]
MEEYDEQIKCVICRSPPRNAVLLECFKIKTHGGCRNQPCKTFLCGTCPKGKGLSCINSYLAEYVRKKDDCLAKWVECEGRLEFLDGSTEADRRKIADCEICRGDVRGVLIMMPYRDYYNSLPTECDFDGCDFEGNIEDMMDHLHQIHRTYFQMDDAWEDFFEHARNKM